MRAQLGGWGKALIKIVEGFQIYSSECFTLNIALNQFNLWSMYILGSGDRDCENINILYVCVYMSFFAERPIFHCLLKMYLYVLQS